MLHVGELLERLDILSVGGSVREEQEITAMTCDSREASPGCLFIAVRGSVTDGHRFIGSALERGASVVVSEEPPRNENRNFLSVVVRDSREARAIAASAWYGDPAKEMRIIGVTGTNGKTTTARLLASMFNECGVVTGYIGTGQALAGEDAVSLERTTPEAEELHRLFRLMVERRCTTVVMEVSSHALAQRRTFGIVFAGAVFTNLTPEHLDFHHDMERYAAAKRVLFENLDPEGFAVVNTDDPASGYMTEGIGGGRVRRCSVAGAVAAGANDVGAVVTDASMEGTRLRLETGGRSYEAFFALPGLYNVMNLTEVFASGVASGIPPEKALAFLASAQPVEGRMERVGEGRDGSFAVVDYAHTPDALEKVVGTLDALKPEGSKLIVVFGCGGNRDRGKRPEMGRIAAAADRVVVTSDNPRDEDPEAIMDEIVAGIRSTGYLRFADRAEAIRCGVNLMKGGDVLLIAGKGHEKYQEKHGEKVYFSDQETALAALRARERNRNEEGP